MTFNDVRHAIESDRDILRAQGVTALYVFGSVARDEAGPGSDVDVMIEIDPESHFNLVDLAGLRRHLAKRLHAKVDVVIRENLHRRIKRDVLREAVQIF